MENVWQKNLLKVQRFQKQCFPRMYGIKKKYYKTYIESGIKKSE